LPFITTPAECSAWSALVWRGVPSGVAQSILPAVVAAGGVVIGGSSGITVGSILSGLGAILGGIGIGEWIYQSSRTPSRGEPNSTVEYPSSTGKGKTVRVYGPDRRGVRDIDYGDQSHSGNDPEVHDWDWSGPKPVRGLGRAPNPGEVP